MLKRSALVLLFCLLYVTTTLAQEHTGGIEFNGRLYKAFDDVVHAASGTTSSLGTDAERAKAAEDLFLACGPRLTVEVLKRGHFDFRYDTMVCFTNEEESDQLYARNQQLKASYQSSSPPSPSGVNQSGPGARDHHHVCNETPRGTPFRYFGYGGAYGDVCPSRRRASLYNFVNSYWQVGEGRTYFHFAQSNCHWWLSASSISADLQMRGWVIQRYSWGRSH